MERSVVMQLIQSISGLFRLIHHKSFQNMEHINIHPAQGKFLALIKSNEGVTQKELAKIHDVKPATITGLILKLEANDYVYRISDEKDKRNMRVFLTPKGLKMAKLSEKFIFDLTSQMFEGFSEEEIDTFLQLMDKIQKNLQ